MSKKTQARASIASILFVAAMGCNNGDMEVPQIDLDRTTTLWIGSSIDSVDWFARVVAGRWSPSGGYVVLDRSEPYLRRYDADGTLVGRSLRDGNGPGEAKRPSTLALLANGKVVVGEGSRLQLFDTAGVYLSEVIVPQGVVDATRGCGNDLLVYGPMREDNAARTGWLVAYSSSDSIAVGTGKVLYRDSVARARRGFGKRVMASDGERIAIYDEYSSEPRLLLFDCRRLLDPPTVISLARRQDASDGAMGLRPGGWIFRGMALAKEYVVWSMSMLPERPDAPGHQEFYVSDGEGTRLIGVTGDPVRLLDGNNDIVMFQTLDDIPRVRIVDAADLLSAGRRKR